MDYKFKCLKCDKQVIISISMKDYSSTGHICECGEELVRDMTDIAGGAIWKCSGAYAQTN